MQKLFPLLSQAALPLLGKRHKGNNTPRLVTGHSPLPRVVAFFCGRVVIRATESLKQKEIRNKQEIFEVWHVLDRAGTKREKRQTRGLPARILAESTVRTFGRKTYGQDCRKELRAWFTAAENADSEDTQVLYQRAERKQRPVTPCEETAGLECVPKDVSKTDPVFWPCSPRLHVPVGRAEREGTLSQRVSVHQAECATSSIVIKNDNGLFLWNSDNSVRCEQGEGL